jgi:tetratricopeptide (TPR) repeat protein
MQWHRALLLMASFVGVLAIGYTIERAGYWPRMLTIDNGVDCPSLPLAREAEAHRDYERAILIYTEALAKTYASTRDAVCLLRERAYARERNIDIAGAQADWNEAIRLQPGKASLYSSRGFFYLRQNRHDLALADFEYGKQIAPQDSAFPYGVGRTYSSLGRFKEAVESYSEAVRLSPEMFPAFQWRAKAYRELHMNPEAAKDEETAKRLKKEFLELIYRTGVKSAK